MELFDDVLVEDYLEDDLEVLEFIEMGFPRRNFIRPNYYEEMSQMDFFRRFRLTKPTVMNLLTEIEEQLEYPDDRNNSLSPMNQLLLTLRFFASSGHLIQTADFMHVHVSTASRVIAYVSRLIASLRPRYVKMPHPRQQINVQNEFFNIAGFPRVLALIDCTHVKIDSPGGDNAEIYRNRKSIFSLNVQCLTDSKLKFIDVVARWPGSTHDATIFANSAVRARLESGYFGGSVILGDSAYPLRSYLMTPLANPVTPGENLYNESLIRTRNAIERVFGIWKRRFPVVAYGLRVKLDTVMAIIVATTVLHNIARDMNEPDPPLPEDINEEELNYLIQSQRIDMAPQVSGGSGNLVQSEFVRYFTRL